MVAHKNFGPYFLVIDVDMNGWGQKESSGDLLKFLILWLTNSWLENPFRINVRL